MSKWKKELEQLPDNSINYTTTRSLYGIHSRKSKWIYLARTTPYIEHLLAPLKEVIRRKFLPAITGQSVFDDNLRNLMGLPARLGGIGVIDPSKKGSFYYENSNQLQRHSLM